jgi:hypothetical protein
MLNIGYRLIIIHARHSIVYEHYFLYCYVPHHRLFITSIFHFLSQSALTSICFIPPFVCLHHIIMQNSSQNLNVIETTIRTRNSSLGSNGTITPRRIGSENLSLGSNETTTPRRIGAVGIAIDAASPQSSSDNNLSMKRRHHVVLTNLPDTYLTWDNYLLSQDVSSVGYENNLLRSHDMLKGVLLSRNLISSQKIGILDLREKFESLLTSINGPYNGLKETLVKLPGTEDRSVISSNQKFISYIDSWNPNLSISLPMLQNKQSTKLIVRQVNAAVEELALHQSRLLEDKKIQAKQKEFAEYFKNHLGNADVNVYGSLTIHNRLMDSTIQMSDHEISELCSNIYTVLSRTPAAIIPLVKAHPKFFETYLSDMLKVHESFSLNASIVASLSKVSSNVPSLLNGTDATSPVHDFIPYKCYQCYTLFDSRDTFLLHMKEHEPPSRSTVDSFHETTFTMLTPTETKLNIIDAIKLFRQGSLTSPPAILWSKKKRQNKRIFPKMKDLDDIYSSKGHDYFIEKYKNMYLSDYMR